MHVEVELRGPLADADYARALAFLKSHGKEVARKERVFVAFEDEDPLLDVRARITNGNPELIVKKGRFGASEAREEFSVKVERGQFIPLVKSCIAMGYDSGIICERNSDVYDYDGVEFALVEVPGHSRYFEAELLVADTTGAEQAKERILKACATLRLPVFNEEDFAAYVRRLDTESNFTFTSGEEAILKLKKMGF